LSLKQIRETEIIKFLAPGKIQFFARLPGYCMAKKKIKNRKMHRVLEIAPFAARTDAYEMQLLCKMIFVPSFIKKQLNVRHANLITLLCGQLG